MADGSEPHRRVQTPRFAEPCARSAFSGSGTPRSSPLETVESSAEAPHGLPNPSRPRNHVAGTSPPLFEGTISGIFFIEINEIKGVAPKMPDQTTRHFGERCRLVELVEMVAKPRCNPPDSLYKTVHGFVMPG